MSRLSRGMASHTDLSSLLDTFKDAGLSTEDLEALACDLGEDSSPPTAVDSGSAASPGATSGAPLVESKTTAALIASNPVLPPPVATEMIQKVPQAAETETTVASTTTTASVAPAMAASPVAAMSNAEIQATAQLQGGAAGYLARKRAAGATSTTLSVADPATATAAQVTVVEPDSSPEMPPATMTTTNPATAAPAPSAAPVVMSDAEMQATAQLQGGAAGYLARKRAAAAASTSAATDRKSVV